jgi:hypothetical protein
MSKFQVVSLILIAGISTFTARAQGPRSGSMLSTPAYRIETLELKAKGLLPNKVFTVFLAADLLGEIATNADGRGSMRAETSVEGDSLHGGLNAGLLRFASPAADDLCLAPAYGNGEGPVSFRREVSGGRAASATTTWITAAQSINDDDTLFHVISWRSVPCVFTF